MRISDWSSDVCSSDLDCRRIACGGFQKAGEAPEIADLAAALRVLRADCGASGFERRPRGPGEGREVGRIIIDADLRIAGMNAHEHFDVLPKGVRSDEHTSELQSLMRISYAVLCW